MRAIKGFTLIELMVTVAVLAILMAIAAPAFNDFFQRYRLRGAADDVTSLLANARAEAVARNRHVAIVFSGSGAAWCVGATAGNAPATAGQATALNGAAVTTPTCTCSNDCRIGDRVMERQGASYSGVSMGAAPSSFTFNPLNGSIPTGTAPAVTFTSPNGTYSLALRVSPLGRGRLCVPNGSPTMAGFQSC